MSKENVAEFMKKVSGDTKLQEKLAELERQHFDKLSALAGEAGFEVNPEDFTEDAASLSDEDMENVAGGRLISRNEDDRFSGERRKKIYYA